MAEQATSGFGGLLRQLRADADLAVIGAGKLRGLSADDVRQALAQMAARYSTAAVSMGRLALKRAIRHAEANDLVARNVAALVDTPGASTRTTEIVYRRELRPVITTGAEIMDELFKGN